MYLLLLTMKTYSTNTKALYRRYILIHAALETLNPLILDLPGPIFIGGQALVSKTPAG